MKKNPIQAVALAALAALPATAAVSADGETERARHMVQAGWFHIMPQVESHELESRVYPNAAALGIPSEFTSEGTGSDVDNSDTLALIYQYFLTDNWAIKIEGGIPAQFDFYGHGTVKPSASPLVTNSVDLGAYDPLATAKQWSPVLMVQYYFGDWQDRLRPYLGLGVTYTWFTDVELNGEFEQALKDEFGAPLSLLVANPGEARVSADAKSDIAPVFNAGLSYDLTERLNLSASISYSLLETTATIDIHSENGTHLTRSEADTGLYPLVTAVLIGYRFGL